jgi:hypothetical protein
MLADVDDDLPVLVKTSDGWKGVSLAYEEILWDEKTIPGDELEAFCIELVAPVDELSPYSVHESEVLQGFDIVREKMCVMSFPFGAKECGWYYNRLEAKKAAEAECARLNEEYRKEKG